MVETVTHPQAYISVTDAAKALGLHANTIRKRIKSGKYTAEWTPSPHGPIQLIPRDQVFGEGVEPPPPSTNSLSFIERKPEPDLQQILTTFVHQLEATAQENGRLKAELSQAQSENRELKARLALPAGQAMNPTVDESVQRRNRWWSFFRMQSA